MRRLTTLLLGFLLLLAAPAAAQRPLLATTLQTTDTTANSVLVGCSVGSTTCTGGIKAGPIAASTLNATGTSTLVAINASGLLTMSGAAPEILFSNATSNWIQWPAVGSAVPTFTTRSVGTRLVLYPNLDGSHADFAIGINPGVLWFGVPTTSESFTWYGGTSVAATLTGTGSLQLVGGISVGTTVTTTGILTPPGLGAGTTQNYAPTGLASAFVLRLSSSAGLTLGGLTGGANGRQMKICNADASTTLSISPEDAGSTAANRFATTAATNTNIAVGACVDFLYDGLAAAGVGRWLGNWGSK